MAEEPHKDALANAIGSSKAFESAPLAQGRPRFGSEKKLRSEGRDHLITPGSSQSYGLHMGYWVYGVKELF